MTDSADEPVRLRTSAGDSGKRLDRFLAEALDLPRNRIQRWIQEERVLVAGRPAKASTSLQEGAEIVCSPPPESTDERVVAEPGELEILFEDEEIVVVNKPARLAVHPGAGRESGTLANRLVAAYPEMAGVGGPGRPGIVHRLDIDTTGLVLLARSDLAYRALSDAFAERRVSKRYLAVCHGRPSPAEGLFDQPIGRHARRRKEMTVRSDGRPARTSFRTLDAVPFAALLQIGLETGRTHQIRVHLKAAGHPLVGDPVYGEARWKAVRGPEGAALRKFGRPALHAWRLDFEHPRDAERVTFVAPPPEDLASLWRALSGRELTEALDR